MLGVDTTFLVQTAVTETDGHAEASSFLRTKVLEKGEMLGCAPQVLLEFIHVVTDPKRFERPLPVPEARHRALVWWNAKEVRRVLPDVASVDLCFRWLSDFQLGRKRLLDTFLAATYVSAGITEILTTNWRDFSIFESISTIDPTKGAIS